MKSMFYGARSINKDLSQWDTSNVVNMEYMFSCTPPPIAGVKNWNVDNVVASHAFCGGNGCGPHNCPYESSHHYEGCELSHSCPYEGCSEEPFITPFHCARQSGTWWSHCIN